MSVNLLGYAKLKSEARQRHDGLKMLRIIGPELDPTYNDQIAVAESHCMQQFVAGGNRAGKSVAVAGKMASVMRDIPIKTWDGREVNCRPEHQRDRPLTIWIIGLQLNHIGQTIYRLLFKPGAYKIIKDLDTGAWRAWRPWEKSDALRENDLRPARPLIPYTEIDESGWAWDNKAARVFTQCKLKNGTEIYCFASTASVKEGDPVDVIWIDERIANSDHYAEWIMRLTDGRGWLMWSSKMSRTVPAMLHLIDQAEIQKDEFERGERKKVTAKSFFFRQDGNPFLPKERVEENREFLSGLNEDELAMRFEGVLSLGNTAIYPFFDKKIHTAIPDDESEWDELAEVLKHHNGIPPSDWTHDLILDPGTSRPAVLFCAVPPPRWRDHRGKEWDLWRDHRSPFFVPYDEIYKPRTPADELARLIKQKMRGVRFRRFIIDGQAGRQKPMSFTMSVKQNYSRAFRDHGIQSEETGVDFIAGGTDFVSRSEIVQDWMQLKGRRKPQLRVVTQNCPNLIWQLQRNQRAMDGDIVLNKEARRERNDLRICLEYWATCDPKHVYVSQEVEVPAWVGRQQQAIKDLFGNSRSSDERMSFGPVV